MTQNLLDGADQINTNQNVDYLAELAGPGKKFDRTKYATEDEWKAAVSRGKYEADQHIRQLEMERAQERQDYLKLQAEYNARAKLEELLERQANREQTTGDTHQTANVDQQPTFDPKQLDILVRNNFQQLKQEEKQTENYNLVQARLQEKLGANYPSLIKQQAQSLGLSDEFVNTLAKTAPNAFFKTFGLDNSQPQEQFQTPPNSSQRSDGFAPRGQQKRTWSYYENMRKADPKLYMKQKTQDQLVQDAIELGKEFEDGNWKQI